MKFKSSKKDKKSKTEKSSAPAEEQVNKTGTLTRLMGKLTKRNSQIAAESPIEDNGAANMEFLPSPTSVTANDSPSNNDHVSTTYYTPEVKPVEFTETEDEDQMNPGTVSKEDEEDDSPILALNDQFELINEYDDSENGDDGEAANQKVVELFTPATGNSRPISRVIEVPSAPAGKDLSEYAEFGLGSGLTQISLSAITAEFGADSVDETLANLSMSAIEGEFGVPAIDNDLSKISMTAITGQFGSPVVLSENNLAKLSLSAINGEFGTITRSIDSDLSKFSMSAINAEYGRAAHEEEVSRISLRSASRTSKDPKVVTRSSSQKKKAVAKTKQSRPTSAAAPLKLPDNVLNHAISINSMASFDSISNFEEDDSKQNRRKSSYKDSNAAIRTKPAAATSAAAISVNGLATPPVPKPRRQSADLKLGTKDTQALASVDVKLRISRFSESETIPEPANNVQSTDQRKASVTEQQQQSVPSPAQRKLSTGSAAGPLTIPAGPTILQRKQSLRMTEVIQSASVVSHNEQQPIITAAAAANSIPSQISKSDSEQENLSGLQRRASVKKYEVNVPAAISLQRRISVSKSDKPDDLIKQIMSFDAPSAIPLRPSTFSLLQKTLDDYEETKKIKGSPIIAKRPSTTPSAATEAANATLNINNSADAAKPATQRPVSSNLVIDTSAATTSMASKQPISISAMAKAESVPVVSKLLKQLQSDDNKTGQKTSINEISKAKIVSRVSSMFEQQKPQATSPTAQHRELGSPTVTLSVADKAKIFTSSPSSNSPSTNSPSTSGNVNHINAAAALIAKAGAAGKVAKFSEIFETKASGNYTTSSALIGKGNSDAAIPRSMGRSASISRHPIVTPRPVILTRGPAKAI